LSSLFCIVSAIGNDYGIFSYQERLQQLLDTIRSVRQRVPEADIFLYDASEDPLPIADVELLASSVDRLTLLADDKYINFLKHKSLDPTPNKFEKKTVGEIQCMLAFLDDLKSSGKTYDRVFKLSGRYELSEEFVLSSYSDKSGKCVMLDREDWYGERVFTMRLWSFDFSLLDSIETLFRTMQRHTYATVTETGKLEIVEFTFTKFIDAMQIPYITVDRIGVRGLMGLGGHYVDQ
jgi:hypothetical protein